MRAFAEATVDYQRLLATVAERMATLVGGGCVLALLSEDDESLVPGAVYFEDEAVMASARSILTNGSVPLRASNLGARIAEHRNGLLIPHVDPQALSAMLSADNRATVRQLDIRSLLVLPLEIRRRLVGIIALARIGPHYAPFDANDEAVARNLTEHAALSITNAQLLESRQREIDDRKHAEDRARRFEALIQASGDFIAMAELDGRVSFINAAGRDLTGIAQDADVAQLDLRSFHTDDGMKRAELIQAQGRYRGPGQLRHGITGELIDTQVSSFLVRDAHGKPFGFATVQHDMREVKALEAHVRQMQRLEALGRLAGGIAHDFNNILSIILSYSTILLADLPPGSAASDDVEEIHTAGERAARLTRQLLAFSRRQVLEPRVVDLNEVVLGMDKMTRRLLGEDVVLRTELSSTLGRVKVDVGQVEQVILNLALNARDAMPNGGVLTIATSNVDGTSPLGEGAAVRLSVADTGAGMDEATRQRAFEPFFTTKANGKGTGLGLATVFGVVEQSGGKISVSSQPGRGATFVIHLPRCDDTPQPSRVSMRPVKTGTTPPTGATILLVEDEAQVRKLIRAILGNAGYRVLDAPGPLEALTESERFPGEIQLLVTDVVMPTMNGRELAALLGRTRQNTKVLYLSGYTEEAIAQHGMYDPHIALLQKPVTPDALLDRVREVLAEPLSGPPEGLS
jgi:PAS domain S-box-containing protein